MTLISAQQLATRLGEVTLLDVRYALGKPSWGRARYDEGHLPGAVFVDLDVELAASPGPGGVGGRHPRPEASALQAAARRWGIQDGREVVVYDQASSLAAGRAWWLLVDAGVSVQVLDGGYAAWVAAGLPTTTTAALPAPGDVVLRPGRLVAVDAGEVAERAPGVRLIDVRAAERYCGDHEPIDAVAGRIPGAENLPSSGLQHDDGRFKSPAEVAESFGALTATDILSCGSGVTAAQAALAAAHAGLPIPRVYVGSYSDWISDPARPVERG